MNDALIVLAAAAAGFIAGIFLCYVSMGRRHTDLIKRINKMENRR